MATLSLNEFLKQAGGTSKDIKTVSTPTTSSLTSTSEQPGYLSRLMSSYSKAGEDIKSGITTGANEYTAGVNKAQTGTTMAEKAKGELQATTGLLRSGLRTVGGVASAVFAPLTAAVEPLIKPAVETALENPTVKSMFDSANALAQKHPESAKDIQNIFDIATMGIGGVVEKPVVSAALKTAGKGLEVAGGVTAGAGGLTKATGKAVAESAIRPTAQEAEKILSYEAKNTLKDRMVAAIKGEVIPGAPTTRGSTAFEQGIMGTERMIGTQAKRAESPLWKNTIAPALKESKEVLTKDELFKPIAERIAKTSDQIKKQGYEDALAALKDAYKGVDNWTLEQAQSLKEDLAKFIPEKVYKGKPIASELTTLQADMAGAIRDKIYNSLKDKNIKNAYITYGNLKNLEKVGVKAITDGGKLGGFGTFWTSIYDSAVTPIKTVGGQVVYRVGDKLEFVGNKGIKTFGEYLKSKGYTIKK